MQEQLIRWNPIKEKIIKERYYIDFLIDKAEALEIVLINCTNENKKIKIIFDGSVETYRKTDETYRLDSLHAWKKIIIKDSSSSNFFQIINSSYLKWLSEESGGLSDYRASSEPPLTHFVIMDDDCILDIVAGYEPKVELINE